MLRNKKETGPAAVPEEPTPNRKSSMFTDLLTRRKASAMPSDTAQNPKVYTVPEKNQGRKGSTFTDLLSRNKRGSTVQEVPRSASSFRKPSIIMEEVGCEKHLDLVLL